ncbi:MAG: hypothetical protein GC181_01350 [Bacteroidetes bacterium]|nr:hypothetical protein [Bacteroidota bacterium]
MDNSFQILLFQAPKHPILCEKYIEGHTRVLTQFGIRTIASNLPDWPLNPDCYCIVAVNSLGEMVGGIRIHKANGIIPLPMENGVGKTDPAVHKFIRSNLENGIAEQCGLWNDNSIKGKGISWVLVNSSIAILNQLSVTKLTGLASDYSMYLFEPAGFRIREDFGNNGDFTYPTNDYIARVVCIEDCILLPTTSSKEKSFISSLRITPNSEIELIVTNELLKLSINTQLVKND